MFGLSKKPEPLLFKAVWTGDEKKTRETLSSDLSLVSARVNAAVRRDHPELEEGATPLHLAARRGHTAIVELLLSLRADPSVQSSSTQSTPLHFAAMGGHADIASILLDRKVGIDVKDAQGCTPLHRAAGSGDEELVELLIARGASVAAKDQEGETPLHTAVRAGWAPVAKILLTAGADVHARDGKGRMPIHSAVFGSVSAPASRGASSNPLDTDAIVGLLNLLLSYGAQINDLDQAGETPFDLLVYLGGKVADQNLIDYFLSHGAKCVRYKSKQPAASTPPPAPPPRVAPPPPKAEAPPRPSHRSPSSWGSAPIVLAEKPITFGRNPDCDIRYMSLTLSHRHARVEPRAGGYFIMDMGSRNGVLIDNVKITGPHRLQPHELVTLGAYEFEFDGKQLIPTHGEISEADLLAEQRMLEQRRSGGSGTTLPGATVVGNVEPQPKSE